MQTIIPLSDGSGLRLTTAKYYTPKGRSIHGKGITPDIIVEGPKTTAAVTVPAPEGAPTPPQPGPSVETKPSDELKRDPSSSARSTCSRRCSILDGRRPAPAGSQAQVK